MDNKDKVIAKNNIVTEIQELFQYIRINYQEGKDYKHITWDKLHEQGVGITNILSPRLKKYCREKFGFPSGVNDYLDYFKNDENGDAVLYRTNQTTKIEEKKGSDILWWCKERLDAQKLDQTPKKCSVCQKKTFKKDGRIKLWDDECRDIGVNEDGWSRKVFLPSPLAYLHSECAKKYFADKERSNQNSTQIKEKILRNLDKICLDPMGHLANAELLKSGNVESYYKKGIYGSTGNPAWKEWAKKVWKVEIEGENIDLEKLELNYCSEIRQKLIEELINQIMQNPSEWKIIEGGEKEMGNNNWIVQHQSGWRNWKIGIRHFRSESETLGKNDWAKIEALLKNSYFSVKNQLKDEKKIQIEKGDNLSIIYSIWSLGVLVMIMISYLLGKKKNFSWK